MAQMEAQITGSAAVVAAAAYVRGAMAGNDIAHDFQHVIRVHQRALSIAHELAGRGATIDIEVVQLGALLHDVYDHKLRPDIIDGERRLLQFLCGQGLIHQRASHAAFIASHVSFSKRDDNVDRCIELDIVTDADRLDAMGAVGIARAFGYGGSRGQTLGESRIHFDHKLLLLAQTIRTEPARREAAIRHAFMLQFVDIFDREMAT